MVDEWNRLSSHVVNTSSIGSFKNRLDRFMDGVLGGVRFGAGGTAAASCTLFTSLLRLLNFLCSGVRWS